MQRQWPGPALVLADLATLVLGGPSARTFAHRISAPRAWLLEVGIDRVLATAATAALFVLAGWLGLGLLACALARVPGRFGAVAARTGAAVLPRAVRVLLAGSAGLGVLLAPVAAGAHPPCATAPVAAVHDRPQTLAAPRWPSDATGPAPGPVWPGQPEHGLVVRPGDSLWLLAAHRLGPAATPADITAAWRRIYAENRDVIGADPARLRPGQHLRLPTGIPPATEPRRSRDDRRPAPQ